MSAIVIGISTEGRSGEETNDGSRNYERVYKVQTTSKTDDVLAVRRAEGLPRMYSPWTTATERDTQAECVSISCEQSSDSPFIWEVRCRYSTSVGENKSENEGENSKDPLERRARITLSFVMGQEILDAVRDERYRSPGETAYSGNPGTAGDGVKIATYTGCCPSNRVEKFDPPIVIDKALPVITIVRNEPARNNVQKIAEKFVNTVNKDPFFQYEPGVVRCVGISVSTELNDNGTTFREVTYEFHVNPEGWDVKVLDVGTKYWSGGQFNVGTLIERNDAGEQTQFLLNGKGGKAADGTATFRIFKAYRSTTFAELNLPQQL